MTLLSNHFFVLFPMVFILILI